MRLLVARFASDESGATAIEYGLIAALIAVAMVAGASAVGVNLNSIFNTLTATLNPPSWLQRLRRLRQPLRMMLGPFGSCDFLGRVQVVLIIAGLKMAMGSIGARPR